MLRWIGGSTRPVPLLVMAPMMNAGSCRPAQARDGLLAGIATTCAANAGRRFGQLRSIDHPRMHHSVKALDLQAGSAMTGTFDAWRSVSSISRAHRCCRPPDSRGASPIPASGDPRRPVPSRSPWDGRPAHLSRIPDNRAGLVCRRCCPVRSPRDPPELNPHVRCSLCQGDRGQAARKPGGAAKSRRRREETASPKPLTAARIEASVSSVRTSASGHYLGLTSTIR
jgi:hypothetical protein